MFSRKTAFGLVVMMQVLARVPETLETPGNSHNFHKLLPELTAETIATGLLIKSPTTSVSSDIKRKHLVHHIPVRLIGNLSKED